MQFEFTPEQIQLRKTVREFAEAEILPHVLEWDEEQIFPLDIVKQLGKLGFLGVVFPEELGGAGLGYIDYAIIMEELARVDPSVGLILAAHIFAVHQSHLHAGNKEQRAKYIPKLTSGEWIGSWALTEPESGSDAGSMRTKAVKQGECWVLDDQKLSSQSQYASVVVTMASTGSRRFPGRRFSAFLVEKDVAGFRVGKKENKLRMRVTPLAELVIPNCAARSRNCWARPAKDSSTACASWTADVSPSPRSRWAPRKALTTPLSNIPCSANSSEPISEFQSIPTIADMATEIDAARLLTYRAGWLEDQGQRVTKNPRWPNCSRPVAVRVANEGRADPRRMRVHQGLSGREILSCMA